MKVVIISGSERRDGNTRRVADVVAEIFRSAGYNAKVINLCEYRIVRCGSCGDCNSHSLPCYQNDDMPTLIQEMVSAQGVIYCAPVHGFGLASEMQRFIERAGVCFLRHNRPLSNKVGGVIVVGRKYGRDLVYAQLVNNLLLNRLILPGSGLPCILDGAAPGEALADEQGMNNVRHLAMRMIETLTFIFDRQIEKFPTTVLPCNERHIT